MAVIEIRNARCLLVLFALFVTLLPFYLNYMSGIVKSLSAKRNDEMKFAAKI